MMNITPIPRKVTWNCAAEEAVGHELRSGQKMLNAEVMFGVTPPACQAKSVKCKYDPYP